MQDSCFKKEEILAFYAEALSRPIDHYEPTILVSLIRGMGKGRNPEQAEIVVKYASHPTAKIRETVANALGRMKNPDSAEALLALLSVSETNPNVRLASRKALQALAGDVDRGYDVEEWRKVFHRGRD